MTTRVVSSSFAVAAFSVLTAAEVPTYSSDVAAILNKRCVECHRAGEAAPMALTSYKDVRPWAKAIRDAVVKRTMPPWFASAAASVEYRHNRTLSQGEIDTLAAWANAGAPEGDASKTPQVATFLDGWNIGKPDMVFDIGKDFEIPADGVVAYQYFMVPTKFTEDRWIEAAEVRPQNRAATHHINVFLMEPGRAKNDPRPFLVGWAPGVQPLTLDPGTASLIKKGTVMMFQCHYTPNGKGLKDRSFVGLRFAKEPPKLRSITETAGNNSFKIPPNAANHEVRSYWEAKTDVDLFAMMPHMHLRGKDFKFLVHYPDGRRELLLDVPKYDFNWQLGYELKKPIRLPKGSKIECIAHFDNSKNNKFNPDPEKEVTWGDQTFEEMMIGFFLYKVPAGV
jgi:hypothetical protein